MRLRASLFLWESGDDRRIAFCFRRSVRRFPRACWLLRPASPLSGLLLCFKGALSCQRDRDTEERDIKGRKKTKEKEGRLRAGEWHCFCDSFRSRSK